MEKGWSKEAELYVIANYHKVRAIVIGDKIGKSKNAVIARAKKLGIANTNDNHTGKPYLDEYNHGKGKHQLLLLAEKE